MGSDDDNRQAAEQGFLELFNKTAETAKKEAEEERKKRIKENLGTFLKGFKDTYGPNKKMIIASISGQRSDFFYNDLYNCFDGCRGHLSNIKEARRSKYRGIKEDKYSFEAWNLGRALGLFLAGIEWGVADPFYDAKKVNIDKYISPIINLLRELGHGVTTRFITNRIKDIARKKPDLDEDHKKVLAYMAAQFSK